MDPSGIISQEEKSDCGQSMKFRWNKKDRSLPLSAIVVSPVKLKGVKGVKVHMHGRRLLK